MHYQKSSLWVFLSHSHSCSAKYCCHYLFHACEWNAFNYAQLWLICFSLSLAHFLLNFIWFLLTIRKQNEKENDCFLLNQFFFHFLVNWFLLFHSFSSVQSKSYLLLLLFGLLLPLPLLDCYCYWSRGEASFIAINATALQCGKFGQARAFEGNEQVQPHNMHVKWNEKIKQIDDCSVRVLSACTPQVWLRLLLLFYLHVFFDSCKRSTALYYNILHRLYSTLHTHVYYICYSCVLLLYEHWTSGITRVHQLRWAFAN